MKYLQWQFPYNFNYSKDLGQAAFLLYGASNSSILGGLFLQNDFMDGEFTTSSYARRKHYM